jgi:predicted RNA-binding protein with PIN domain
MPFIIDGYNLYHAACKYHDDWASLTPDALCRLIAADMARLRDRAVVVFDGTRTLTTDSGAGSDRVLEVLYSGPGVSADSVIKEKIASCPSPRTWTVVSSDRDIRRSVRRRRAVSLGARDYLEDMIRRLNRPHRGPGEPSVKFQGLSSEQTGVTDRWLEAFGYDPTEIPPRPPEPVKPEPQVPDVSDLPAQEKDSGQQPDPTPSPDAADSTATHASNKSLDQMVNELLDDDILGRLGRSIKPDDEG